MWLWISSILLREIARWVPFIQILFKKIQNTASWNATAIGTSIQMFIVISLPLQLKENPSAFIL